MKQLLIAAGFSFLAMYTKGQQVNPVQDTEKVIVDNDKMRVIEFVSNPGKDVCGKGKHTHPPHLSILLTDAKVTVTSSDGKTQVVDVPAGAAFWSPAETHIAINSGNKITRAYIVETK